MKKIAVVILAIAFMATGASAQTVIMEGENVIVKHTFYSTVNGSSLNFTELETITIATKNGNVTIEFVDWGKDASKNAILIRVIYQNQSTMVILERGVWGMQVANLKLAKNVPFTIGLTDLFLGSPTKYAKICASLWDNRINREN